MQKDFKRKLHNFRRLRHRVYAAACGQARRAAIGADPFLGAGWQHLERRRGEIGRPRRDSHLRLPRTRAIGSEFRVLHHGTCSRSDLAELLDHLGWPIAAVAGCSMGGCVAQAFAGMYLSRVSALGLIDTTAWYGEEAPKNWSERAAAARSKGLAGMVEFQVTRWFSDRFRTAHPEIVKELTEVFLANDVDCYAATCVMLGDADLRPFCRRCACRSR